MLTSNRQPKIGDGGLSNSEATELTYCTIGDFGMLPSVASN